MEIPAQLTIVVDARPVLPIAYGTMWEATVRRVVDGKLADRKVNLRLLDNSDGHLYGGRFRSTEETSVRLRLQRLPQGDVATEGFSAADGRDWKLVNVDTK